MDKTVGIIGLGIMGGAIARNLVARGWRVIGFDTDAAKCAELAEADVVIVENVAHVVKNAPIVMTSLPTPAAVESVAKAIVDSGQPPCIVVELSTLYGGSLSLSTAPIGGLRAELVLPAA